MLHDQGVTESIHHSSQVNQVWQEKEAVGFCNKRAFPKGAGPGRHTAQ